MKHLFYILFVLVVLFASVVNVGAEGLDYDDRHNACRTFHTFSTQKFTDKFAEDDGLQCGAFVPEKKVKPVIQDDFICREDMPCWDCSTMGNGICGTNPENPIENPETPVENVPTENGNPGNDKPVGNAGEHCAQGMCENPGNSDGEHGNSGND